MEKKITLLFFLTTFIFVFALTLPTFSFAQGMMGNNMMSGNNAITQSNDGLPAKALAQAGHTAREEAEGKEIWENLSAKGGSASGGQADQITCEDLSDDDFGALGEYFMGQMAGEQHEAMNNMMIQMMGADGEKHMHIAIGKRMSNCEPNAPMPQNMMNMMGNFASNPTGWFGWGFGWISMILFWGFIILAIVALIKWIMYSSKHIIKNKSAFDILKERYARGEIDKKEFEEKKKDLI